MRDNHAKCVTLDMSAMVTCKYWHAGVILPFAHSVDELLLVLLFGLHGMKSGTS